MEKNRPVSKRLFVGSIPYRFTEGELLSLFVPFGKVVSLKIMHNRWGKSRGMGFVEFEDLDSAITAKKELHNHHLGDLSIIVDYSEPDPFLTPEGQARHEEALNRHPKRREEENRAYPKKTAQKIKKQFPKNTQHSRQSVYDSRTHHARVGAKFSRRNKKNK